MKKTTKTAPASAPATPASEVQTPATAAPATTATLDTTMAVLAHAVPSWLRWTVEGWANHLRASRHQTHAANSFAKHEREFIQVRDIALALTVARCVDHGLTPETARDLIEERLAARSEKAAG